MYRGNGTGSLQHSPFRKTKIREIENRPAKCRECAQERPATVYTGCFLKQHGVNASFAAAARDGAVERARANTQAGSVMGGTLLLNPAHRFITRIRLRTIATAVMTAGSHSRGEDKAAGTADFTEGNISHLPRRIFFSANDETSLLRVIIYAASIIYGDTQSRFISIYVVSINHARARRSFA